MLSLAIIIVNVAWMLTMMYRDYCLQKQIDQLRADLKFVCPPTLNKF